MAPSERQPLPLPRNPRVSKEVFVPETQSNAAAKLTAICPTFIVPDVVATAEHYRDVLGFKILGYFLDPPVFAMVARDAAEIHFGKADVGTSISPNSARRKGI